MRLDLTSYSNPDKPEFLGSVLLDEDANEAIVQDSLKWLLPDDFYVGFEGQRVHPSDGEKYLLGLVGAFEHSTFLNANLLTDEEEDAELNADTAPTTGALAPRS